MTPPPSFKAYRRTPVDKRDLSIGGDPLERLVSATLRQRFPPYETLWREFIWDVTDRDFDPTIGQPRNLTNPQFALFAEAHYTFLRSFMYATASLATPCLSFVGKLGQADVAVRVPFDVFYINERLLNYYAHLGRARDMARSMADSFARIADDPAGLRDNQGDLDESKIRDFLERRVSKPCREHYDSWSAEAWKYRNLLHMRAAVSFYPPGPPELGRYLVLRADRIKRFETWGEVRERPANDFVNAEDTMNKHLGDLVLWATPLWEYFIAVVRDWARDEKAYRARLELPPDDTP